MTPVRVAFRDRAQPIERQHHLVGEHLRNREWQRAKGRGNRKDTEDRQGQENTHDRPIGMVHDEAKNRADKYIFPEMEQLVHHLRVPPQAIANARQKAADQALAQKLATKRPDDQRPDRPGGPGNRHHDRDREYLRNKLNGGLLPQTQMPLGAERLGRLKARNQRRQAGAAHQIDQSPEHPVGSFRVKVARRFIGKDQLWFERECAGNADPSGLSARQLIGIAIGKMRRQVNQFQQPFGLGVQVTVFHALDFIWLCHQIANCQTR